MLSLSSTVFGGFGFAGLAVTCLIVVLLTFLRLLSLRVEGSPVRTSLNSSLRSLGWFWAFVELVVGFAVLNYAASATCPEPSLLGR